MSGAHAPAASALAGWPARTLDLRRTLAVAAALLALAAVAALAASIAGPAALRDQLAFGFPELPRTPREIASILANNVRMLGAVFVASWAAQLAAGIDGGTSRWARAIVRACDAAVLLSAGGHALLVGVGVGAYGSRMVTALLPHGPLELAAYSVALALYASARRGAVGRRRWLATAGVSVLLLMLAAPLEVLVAL